MSTNYVGIAASYLTTGRDYYRLHVTLPFLPALLPWESVQDAVANALSQLQDTGGLTPVGSFSEAGEGEAAVAVFDVVINENGPLDATGATVGDLVAGFEAQGLKVTEIESVSQSDTGNAGNAGGATTAAAAAADSANTGPANTLSNWWKGIEAKYQGAAILIVVVLVLIAGALVWYYLPKRSSRAVSS